jgi:zinc D-Ala-D-Ala carboxypeptidase
MVLLVAALMTEVLSTASGAQSQTLTEQPAAVFPHRLPLGTAAPACAVGETATTFPGGSEQFAVLDPTYRLPKGWKPAHLAWVNKSQQLQREAAHAWRTMQLAAAHKAIRLTIVSAYRSESHQSSVFNRNVKKNGRTHAVKYVARPGHSEHQLALTVDVGLTAGATLNAEPVTTPKTKSQRAANWLAAHAFEYGWVRSYPKDGLKKTCYGSEPWHWRFIGVAEAHNFWASGLTLREYLWQKR